MDGILHHNLKIALPLIVVFIAVPLGLMAANSMWQIASLNAMPGTRTAMIGDGVDVFTQDTGPVTASLGSSINDNGGVLTVIAVVATALLLVEAIRRMIAKLRPPSSTERGAFLTGALTVPIVALTSGPLGIVLASTYGLAGMLHVFTGRRT